MAWACRKALDDVTYLDCASWLVVSWTARAPFHSQTDHVLHPRPFGFNDA